MCERFRRVAIAATLVLFSSVACTTSDDQQAPDAETAPPDSPATIDRGPNPTDDTSANPSRDLATSTSSTEPVIEQVPRSPLADAPTEGAPASFDFTDHGFSPGSMLLDLSPEDLALDLDRMVDLGSRWVRADIDWSRIEQVPGSFDWSTTDDIVAEARIRGLHVLGLLVYTPTWARPEGTPDKAPPVELADFERFVEAAVDRYGEHVRAWEIWNEPNVASFWFPEPDPRAYAELLNRSAAVIRRDDPEAIVITGGLAPAADIDGVELSPATFLEQLYETATADAFDAVGVHPYTYPGFPSESQDWNLFAALPKLRKIMTDRGDDAKSMWLTEFGAPTGAGERSVSDDDQARMIREAMLEVRELPWAGPLFIYALRDQPDGSPDDIEANFGLLRSDGADKPAAVELRELAESAGSTNSSAAK